MIKEYTWSADNKGGNFYIKCVVEKLILHRFIMNCPKGFYVDHINHNTLDNRIANLRICTNSQNQMNHKKLIRNKSGHSGVYRKKNGSWIAFICFKSRNKNIGVFKTFEQALNARVQAEKQYYGEYASNE